MTPRPAATPSSVLAGAGVAVWLQVFRNSRSSAEPRPGGGVLGPEALTVCSVSPWMLRDCRCTGCSFSESACQVSLGVALSVKSFFDPDPCRARCFSIGALVTLFRPLFEHLTHYSLYRVVSPASL